MKLRGAVYASNADLSLSGGGNLCEFIGVALSYQISITGNYAFHYDEQLENFYGSDPIYKIIVWSEPTNNADRVPFDDTDNYHKCSTAKKRMILYFLFPIFVIR